MLAGRYGLSSKEFDPYCVRAVLSEAAKPDARNHFTVGIVDDVTKLSLNVDRSAYQPKADMVQALFFGLGSDGTVGANKNSIKIIGQETDKHVQGYFVYDSKKSGAVTVSHLRFGNDPIRSSYLIDEADFVACHQFEFLDKFEMLERAAEGATFLLNSPIPADEVWGQLPREVQEQIIDKKLDFWTVDAYRVAREANMGSRINTIMQTCFFALAEILPKETAIAKIKEAIEKTYGKRGPVLVERNFRAVDTALEHLSKVETPQQVTSERARPPIISEDAPEFVQKVTALMLGGKGDLLPVSAFPIDGTWDTGTTQWEKRNIATEIPVWESDVCIQCNHCALVCPHAAIRAKVYDETALEAAPEAFSATAYKAKDFKGLQYTIQVAPEDCTGCHLCVEVCPAKDKSNPRRKAINMAPQRPIREQEKLNYSFFLDIPEVARTSIARLDAKGSQFMQPLFEYSGACAGCGETPYVKLISQLFGDRLLIANATGCSSIYGGNLPTTPYTVDANGRGPAWANSLFEDNAEFGLGFRLAVDHQTEQARALLERLAPEIGQDAAADILGAIQESEEDLVAQRARVAMLKEKLARLQGDDAQRLAPIADYLVKKSVWILGGDGWAYDIGYGGLDHVLSMERNVNVLVMDTEVYSNTGGQQSKATPLGASAKFAVAGKETSKKDLGMEAMSYGHVYVAQVAFGSNMNHTVKAMLEAEAYPGPSLIIAYSPCIAHGYDLRQGVDHQKLMVETGLWPLYRFDPRRPAEGRPPLQLDSRKPRRKVSELLPLETRFRMVEKQDPARYKAFLERSQQEAESRFAVYEQLAGITIPHVDDAEETADTTA